MRLYFIKDFDDRKHGGLLHKAGTNAILWETTALRAIHESRAVRYEERYWVKIEEDEPQTASEAEPESDGTDEGTGKETPRKKKKTTTE